MIEVKCIGGECHGLSVKIEPQPTYYEVVDPRDRTRRITRPDLLAPAPGSPEPAVGVQVCGGTCALTTRLVLDPPADNDRT